MRIENTTQYLNCLNKIAEISEKENPTSIEISIKELMLTAVSEFEFNEIKKYPVNDFLLDRYKNSWFSLN